MNRIATALLLPATLSISRANPPDKACSLLTDAEITATVGAPSKSQDDQMAVTQGPAKGQTMKLCTWTVPTGNVNVAFGKVADLEAGRSAFRAQMRQTIDLLKKRGWTIEEKSFGSDATCWIGTPPTGDANIPRGTGCAGATNGFGISVGTNGSARIEIDSVKKLLDAAMRRLG